LKLEILRDERTRLGTSWANAPQSFPIRVP
jgi:hypothetical protein